MVRNLESPRSGRPVANQFVVRTDNGTFFQSYRTLVAKVDNNGRVLLTDAWNYSNTTSKYLYQFLDGYGYSGLNSAKVRAMIKNGTFKVVGSLEM